MKNKLAAILMDIVLISGTAQLGIPLYHALKLCYDNDNILTTDDAEDKILNIVVETIISSMTGLTLIELGREIKNEEKEKKLVK